MSKDELLRHFEGEKILLLLCCQYAHRLKDLNKINMAAAGNGRQGFKMISLKEVVNRRVVAALDKEIYRETVFGNHEISLETAGTVDYHHLTEYYKLGVCNNDVFQVSSIFV